MRRKFQQQKPELDIIRQVLDALITLRPDAVFVQSLRQQYLERGSLSKKQLQGLHSKASKVEELPAAWVASLQAIIIKMPTRFKSEMPVSTKLLPEKDETIEPSVTAILEKYPQHKRVLFFRSKLDNNEILTATETAELKKFSKLLLGT